MDSERLDHQLRADHPPFCSPCAVTIHDQDCLMAEPNQCVVYWTGNLTPEGVLKVLDRARRSIELYQERKE